MYFDKDWSKPACKLVSWMTQYSAVARDDYKRCVCDKWGSGAADCAQGPDDTSNRDEGSDPSPSPSPSPEPSPSPSPEPSPEPSPSPSPEPSPSPSPEPSPSPSPSPSPDVWRTWASLQEIRDTPHYSPESYSRTLYQVDRELDFL
mmetsp:Transcript_30643/g.37880  ORF Transcript_30643/g.37880 Transcript_30643/m.37880 type:complete len:146 (-) Transcript_30643:204-641(-)|eukprot:CAMPEP_0170460542 /NCGR_PEP_ID=MMETSP0123-20130129/6850_1 /TAXON_ID=182087 /ORGANISM="Favella ehrenbergii, Strain Fehren 1" /LENGTH=145 /DNA_ID=CAMNT_0010725471 /DNA_START=1052 /DNA_END=1489 /DNA_ORIENTATION=-